MENKRLDVSVLVCCYNKEEYLNECIESIKRQSKTAREIILVHDGCDAPAAHIAATTIILPDNRGVVAARDEAFRYSRGELILFVDGDDILSPDYLEKMWRVIAKGADVAYPDLFIWNGPHSSLSITPKKITPEFVRDFKRVVIPVTSLMKREIYTKVGGFRVWPVLEDLDFWVRAMCNGYIFRKAETLLWYRRVPGTRNTLDLAERKKTLDKIMEQFTFTKDTICLK